MAEKFIHIRAEGTPYEIGLAVGQQGREKVKTSVECYRGMFWDYSGVSWDKACRYAHTFIPVIEKYDPDIMEEIRGIAEGSGFTLDEILALNVRSEIVLQGSQVDALLGGGCTSVAVMPYKSDNGHTLLAQNWDWKEIAQGALIVLEIHQKNKPDILMLTEAGIVGKIGFNSAGIGVCLNALGSDKRWEGETLPLHIALRGVLNSFTLSDAIQAAGNTPLACCANFMMAGAQGQCISMEIGPGEIDVIYPDGRGYVTHTNHFYGPRTAHIRDTGRMAFPDTYLRQGRIQDLLREKGEAKIGTADIAEILRDHVGYPDSICRHNDEREPEAKRCQNNFSIIMDLTTREALYSEGAPCCHPYIPVKLESKE